MLTKLTTEQRIMAEENYYLVDRFLSFYRYSVEEYYDVAVFGYLQAVQEYVCKAGLKDKYKLSTIAYRSMFYTIKKEQRKKYRKKRYAPILSLDEQADYVFEPYLRDSQDISEKVLDKVHCDYLLNQLTKEQRKAVLLRCQGHICKEIAEKEFINIRNV